MKLLVSLWLVLTCLPISLAFLLPNKSSFDVTRQQAQVPRPCFLQASTDSNTRNVVDKEAFLSRRQWMVRTPLLVAMMTTTAPFLLTSSPALALVKGVAPPPPKSKGGATGDKTKKCTNVEECQAQAEKRQQEEAADAAAAAEPAQTTAGGTKYRDLVVPPTDNGGRVAKVGDQVTVYYKVLKLGKRSFDGLSGEGTVVFSRGYGLEDDEKVPGDKTFVTTLGSPLNIVALNEAVQGMQPGGVRRFSVFPSKGWRKPGAACDGGPGGSGAGGEIRTDYVVVPTASVVQEETCFDMTKQPFPVSYAQQRRMAQRFDQSLIMEVTLVDVADGF